MPLQRKYGLYGDFKLLAMLRGWGGLADLPLTILLSLLCGREFWIIIILKTRAVNTPCPGPYLAIVGGLH